MGQLLEQLKKDTKNPTINHQFKCFIFCKGIDWEGMSDTKKEEMLLQMEQDASESKAESRFDW